MTDKRLKIDTTIKTKNTHYSLLKRLVTLRKQSFQQMHC